MRTSKRPQLSVTDRTLGRHSELQELRRSGSIPASLYGGREEPRNVQINERALGEYLGHYGTGAILELSIDGKRTPAIVKEIHRKPTTDAVMHVAFQRIVMADELKTSVPIHYHGGDVLQANGLVLEVQLNMLEVHGRADQIPDSVTVDVSGLQAGDVLTVGSIPLPKGIALQKNAEMTAASVSLPRSAVAEGPAEEAPAAELPAE
jgi:large subunit ribosomal protein L25